MKEIPLTQGKVALVDDDDFEWLNQSKWLAKTSFGLWYAVNRTTVAGKPTVVLMHRLITSAPIGMEVDHIDGDGLNNTRRNLRIVTRNQNRFNLRLRADNKSGYKGVFCDKRTGRWCAHIGFYGQRKNLGYFATPEEAARAYDIAACELFGEYARLNFKEIL